MTEDQLIIGLKKKDPKVFEELYDKYSAALYGVVLRIVDNHELAEEVINDAFIKIWDKGDQYDKKRGRLFTWLMNLTRNLAIDKVRSRKYKEDYKTDSYTDDVYTIDREKYVEPKPDDIGVQDLLSNLSSDLRSVLYLQYFKGFTQSEISKEFDIPLGTVKTRTRKALLTLRNYLQ